MSKAEIDILSKKIMDKLNRLSEETFSKSLSIKKEFLSSLDSDEIVLLHKRLNELRKEIPNEEMDSLFYTNLIMTDLVLIAFSPKEIKLSD
ncbi:hypothetical protein [Enterococcus faecalis]|uniref:Uncharacterized protein n=1 Tax=Enterococcus faecalis RP2S-4 TaxID=1244145 RepID=A0ABC9TID5_ENTFL|nr:hypothetical protein [Enterococcus faecalis]EPI05076.1 hypothetical protein D358_02543 [Enterococcus faecalis RP2S-4]